MTKSSSIIQFHRDSTQAGLKHQ